MEEEKKEEVKEEIKKEKPKRSTKSKIITVLLCISFFCVFSILIFTIFYKNDNDSCNIKCERKSKEVNINELKTKLEDINKKAREIVNKEMAKSEFETKAKEYFTKKKIDELLTYYDESTKMVCIGPSLYSVEGGYMTDDADRVHYLLEITKVTDDTIEATGYYGEMTTLFNDLSKQKITYKLEDGNWKVDTFEIKAYD